VPEKERLSRLFRLLVYRSEHGCELITGCGGRAGNLGMPASRAQSIAMMEESDSISGSLVNFGECPQESSLNALAASIQMEQRLGQCIMTLPTSLTELQVYKQSYQQGGQIQRNQEVMQSQTHSAAGRAGREVSERDLRHGWQQSAEQTFTAFTEELRHLPSPPLSSSSTRPIALAPPVQHGLQCLRRECEEISMALEQQCMEVCLGSIGGHRLPQV